MDAVTRRKFLLASGVGGAGLLSGAVGLTVADLLRLGARSPDQADSVAKTGKLVVVTLYGGNDGLNTVVPYSDARYHSARPGLAYRPERVLRLDDRLGLNPVMTGFKRIWAEKRLAIVLGVGYPKPDRSHFRSMDIWQTAAPAGPVNTGWVGRWLDATAAPAEAAISFEPVLPPLLVGKTRSGACVTNDGLHLPTGLTVDMLASMGRRHGTETPMQAVAAASYADLVKVGKLVRTAAETGDPSVSPSSIDIPATNTGGADELSAQLSLVARCVEAHVPTRVYSVSLGGFDTHAAELAGHESLLKRVDRALTTFVDRMATSEAGRRVTVVVYSEFGRRVQGNASEGTDHGTAGPVFVLGPRVAGGFHGEQPGLGDLDAGDLKATVDFRDVFGSALASVLDAEPERFLEGYRPTLLPLLKPG